MPTGRLLALPLQIAGAAVFVPHDREGESS